MTDKSITIVPTTDAGDNNNWEVLFKSLKSLEKCTRVVETRASVDKIATTDNDPLQVMGITRVVRRQRSASHESLPLTSQSIMT